MSVAASVPRRPRLRLLAPLRHREFRLLWTGMSASLVGDGIMLVALAWQVYTLSGAPAAMSAVGVALSAPQVATLLLGGVAGDRWDPRRIMLVTDLVRGACLAALTALALSGTLAVWHLLALAAVYGGAAGFFGPSFDALVPRLVPHADRTGANALDQFIRPAAMQVLGPTLGGVVIGFGGPGSAFLVDTATFAFSALCLWRMSTPAPQPAAEEAGGAAPSVWRDMRDGLSYVLRNTWLWATLVAATFAYLLFIGPTEVLLPYLVRNVMHGSGGQLGLVLASGGMGAILAALVTGQLGVPRKYMTFIYLMWTAATLAIAGYGLATTCWQLAATCALVNGFEAAGAVAWATTKQRIVAAGMLGRVSSVDWFVATSLVPVSYALAAPAAHLFGVRRTLVIAGVLGAIVTLVFLFLPGVRAVHRDSPRPEAP
jgi:MFS family permease